MTFLEQHYAWRIHQLLIRADILEHDGHYDFAGSLRTEADEILRRLKNGRRWMQSGGAFPTTDDAA